MFWWNRYTFDWIICDESFHNVKCNYNSAQPNGSFNTTLQIWTTKAQSKVDVHCEAKKGHKFYFRVAQTPFKEMFWNHNKDFNHEQYIKSTELSKYIWSLKDAGTPYTINWPIAAQVKGTTQVNYCPFCLTEKYHLIEYFNDILFLNKKSEFINACRHQSKLLLKNLKRNDSMDWKNVKGTSREVFLSILMCIFTIFRTK